MPDDSQSNDAGVAMPIPPSTTAVDTAAVSVAGDAKLAALDDGLKYTLTALEAIELFAKTRRRPPSLRSIQRYCDEGTIRGTKIKTTFGQEWLINEDSLMQHIKTLPIEVGVSGDVGDANKLPPSILTPNIASVRDASGDAGVARAGELATPAGETRSLASVLIENAKLLAKLEGKDEVMTERNVLVGELRDDRTFLREELTEARKLRGDVKEIAQEMLRTLKAVALRGLLEEEKKSPVVVAEIITQTGESRPA